MMKTISLVLLLTVNAFGADHSFTIAKIDPRVLGKQIAAAGIQHGGIRCSPTEDGIYRCVVVSPRSSPDSVISDYIYVDPRIALDSAREQAIALAKKMKNGMASPAEKDELLLKLCFLLISADQ